MRRFSYSGVPTGKFVIYKQLHSQPGTWVVSGALAIEDAQMKIEMLQAKGSGDEKYSIHAEVDH
jgi:hypothetical protein